MGNEVELWVAELNALWFKLGRIEGKLAEQDEIAMLDALDTISLCIDESGILEQAAKL